MPMMNQPGFSKLRFQFGIQMPDPMNFINTPYDRRWKFGLSDRASLPPEPTELLPSVLAILAVLLIALIALRWIALFTYRKRLTASEEIDHVEHAHIYEYAKSLSKRFGVRMPRVVVADVPCPLMIGSLKCTIALPPKSLHQLTEVELEATLAHEFAHIKRRDNVKLWAAIMCRDLMFFNPFTWIAFQLLATERERATDYLASVITGKPIELAGAIVKVAETLSASAMPRPALGVIKSDFAPRLSVTQRVNDLLHFKPHKRLIFRLLPLTILFLILFYVRFYISLRLPGNYVFSFFG